MRSVLGVVVLVAAIFVRGAFAADEPPKVRTMAGRHQQAGSTEVSGWFSATLFADGSFTASFYLGSLDCNFIDFRASHQRASFDVVPDPRVIVDVEIPGEFTLDATMVVLDAPLWVYSRTGALINRGLFRRCGVDDTIIAFRLTIRSANFAPLGRYDGEISATLLSGATMQRSFSGTFSAVSPMPFRPITGFLIDRGRVQAGECFGLRWQTLPGAVWYALEYVGPGRRFSARAFSATPESERDLGWGVVVLPSMATANICTSVSTPAGTYEIRAFGLDGGLAVVAGSGSSVPVPVYVIRSFPGSP